MSGAKGFDWPALMRVAFHGLGLNPAEFWALTPSEFLILLGPESGAAPLRRDAFEAHLARFPDTKDEDGHDRDG
ncbi:rcc01693 family protein [Gymnodinialimonas ulvae]|uniref:rcc01693 family protein n=1 Tax=Gymnodinialimonas ulvae TaxID=3126504 RepID=UPI00309C07FE